MSPNYPGDYDSNTICSWTIETRQLSDYVVEVTFDDFMLESDNMQGCSSDYLEVYDGLSQSGSDVIGTFCGFIGPGTKVFSTGRHLTLQFVTNTEFNYRGFKLSYFAVPAGMLDAILMYKLAGIAGGFWGMTFVAHHTRTILLAALLLILVPQKPTKRTDRNCQLSFKATHSTVPVHDFFSR